MSLSYKHIVLIPALLLASCTGENVMLVETEETPPIIVEIDDTDLVKRVHDAGDGQLALECVTLVFPFDLVVDGEHKSISSPDQYWSTLLSEHTGSDFVYPISIIHRDGQVSEALDAVSLTRSFAGCIPQTGWSHDIVDYFLFDDQSFCVSVEYPLRLTDGRTYLTADNELEALGLVSSHDSLYYVWPVDLVSDDGSKGAANNADELHHILSMCKHGQMVDLTTVLDEMPLRCLDIQYPHPFLGSDGLEHMISDKDQYYHLDLWGDLQDWVYPVHLHDDYDHIVTASSSGDLAYLSGGCDMIASAAVFDEFLIQSDIIVGSGSTTFCHWLSYPFTVYLENGGRQVIEDEDQGEDLVRRLSGDSIIEVDYPLTISTTDGTTELTDFEDLLRHMLTCS